MPGMIKGETSSLSHSPSLSVSTQSFSSLSHVSAHQSSPSSSSTPAQLTWLQELRSEERGLYIIHLLLACANAVANNNMEYTNLYLEQLSVLASLTGDPMQRVSTYFMEGLAARITKSWPGVYKALHSTHLPSIMDILAARQVFFSVCPYLKFAFLMRNQAILGAMDGEKVVHIIDLEASDPVQWLALLQEMNIRQRGPLHLRITSVSMKRDVLEQTGQLLSDEAEKLDFTFQFHPVISTLENLHVDLLKVKSGEAIAISSMMKLHSLLAKETALADIDDRPVCPRRSSNIGNGRVGVPGEVSPSREEANTSGEISLDRGAKRSREMFEAEAEVEIVKNGEEGSDADRRTWSTQSGGHGTNLERGSAVPVREESAVESCTGVVQKVLQNLQSLSPKVMVVVEQDSNDNSVSMPERFVEALHYYSAMFDSLELTLPQHCLERVTLEKFLLGQEIKNIVACEGVERVERHEKQDRWKARMQSAGFVPLALSMSAVLQAKRLLHEYPCDGYRLKENHGCLTICWQETPLYAASVWTV